MNSKMIALFAGMTARMQHAAAHRCDQKGQGTLEYVGIVVVAALLVSFIVAAVQGVDIQGFITTTINRIKTGQAPF